MKLRDPQRNLFDLEPCLPQAGHWRDGALIDHLGKPLRLRLNTDRRQAVRENDVLHLPLPPEAGERQIQDAAESWLRREAKRLFTHMIAQEAQRSGRDMPTLALSFSLRGGWAQAERRSLRLNWRLIEQPLPVIELTLRRAVAALPAEESPADLFSALAA